MIWAFVSKYDDDKFYAEGESLAAAQAALPKTAKNVKPQLFINLDVIKGLNINEEGDVIQKPNQEIK